MTGSVNTCSACENTTAHLVQYYEQAILREYLLQSGTKSKIGKREGEQEQEQCTGRGAGLLNLLKQKEGKEDPHLGGSSPGETGLG